MSRGSPYSPWRTTETKDWSFCVLLCPTEEQYSEQVGTEALAVTTSWKVGRKRVGVKKEEDRLEQQYGGKNMYMNRTGEIFNGWMNVDIQGMERMIRGNHQEDVYEVCCINPHRKVYIIPQDTWSPICVFTSCDSMQRLGCQILGFY